MPKFLTVTVREDAPGEQTIIFHDQDGNELGSLVVDLVPKGLRVELWNGNDTRAETVLLRK